MGTTTNKIDGRYIISAIVTVMLVIILTVIAALIVVSVTNSSIFIDLTSSSSVINETGGFINSSGYTLGQAGVGGFASPSITNLINSSNNYTIALANATVSGAGVLTNATATTWSDEVLVSYTYTFSTGQNIARVNVSAIGESFGDFVTNLIAFLAVIGTIVGVVWLILYTKKLFDKKTGLSDIAA